MRLLFAFLLAGSFLVPFAGASHIGATDECVWNTQPSTSTLQMTGITGTSTDDVWSSGRDAGAPADGDIVRYDGEAWSHFQDVPHDLRSVFAVASDDVWAPHASTVATQGPYHYTGATFALTTSDSVVVRTFRSVYGAGLNDYWTVEDASLATVRDRIFRSTDGANWALFSAAPDALGLTSIHGTATNNVWAVGGNPGTGTEAIRWDGASWTVMETGLPANIQLARVWVESATSAWAVAASSSGLDDLFHFDGTDWDTLDTATGLLFTGLWGLSGSNIWITTTTGQVVHYSGTTDFLVQETGVSSVLVQPWAPDSSHVWAVGDSGIIKQESCHPCTFSELDALSTLINSVGTAGLYFIILLGVTGAVIFFMVGKVRV